MRLVIAIAARYRHYGLPMADLVQEGHVGLLEAAARFEPERDVRFSPMRPGGSGLDPGLHPAQLVDRARRDIVGPERLCSSICAAFAPSSPAVARSGSRTVSTTRSPRRSASPGPTSPSWTPDSLGLTPPSTLP
jgi:hypothetical protein